MKNEEIFLKSWVYQLFHNDLSTHCMYPSLCFRTHIISLPLYVIIHCENGRLCVTSIMIKNRLCSLKIVYFNVKNLLLLHEEFSNGLKLMSYLVCFHSKSSEIRSCQPKLYPG